jgi:hypothetical protein
MTYYFEDNYSYGSYSYINDVVESYHNNKGNNNSSNNSSNNSKNDSSNNSKNGNKKK